MKGFIISKIPRRGIWQAVYYGVGLIIKRIRVKYFRRAEFLVVELEIMQ